MTETFTRFDAADYLKTEEDMSRYLDAAAEEGDPQAIIMALGTIARAQNMTKLARDAGVTREGLYKALSPDGNPGFSTIARIAHALGYTVRFERLGAESAGMADERAGTA